MVNIIIYDSSVKPQTPKHKRPVMAAIVKDFKIYVCLFISKSITNQVTRLILIHGDVYLMQIYVNKLTCFRSGYSSFLHQQNRPLRHIKILFKIA